ncbi:hypothetical protein RchiOBHm_Chr2g0153131 [Rosa chinensis]|uniref:Uncharacterized protein n=1 Tax=Rosa chinensis TaxID=74649 RepID=A0A2P6S0L2_ROSCH|nr:hypothetical protein RchiOBHm_Chr2g0153131 [Rosa chinensis]
MSYKFFFNRSILHFLYQKRKRKTEGSDFNLHFFTLRYDFNHFFFKFELPYSLTPSSTFGQPPSLSSFLAPKPHLLPAQVLKVGLHILRAQ